MATTLAGVSFAGTRVAPTTVAAGAAVRVAAPTSLRFSRTTGRRAAPRRPRRPAAAGPSTPPDIADKVKESIRNAEEACAGDPASGECVAAWDEVEELSAAASHARDRLKSSDPLEDYCKDNPETEECRTYED